MKIHTLKIIQCIDICHFCFANSKDGTRDGEPLRYGQVFYLSTMDNEGGNVSYFF